MKKCTLIFMLLALVATTSAQVILNRFPIELKKSSDYFQIINATNPEKDYFSVLTDKENCTLLKFNSALFFSDSLSVPRPDNTFDFMSGITFSLDKNPNVYWCSKDYKKIKVIHFDLENHKTTFLDYENDFTREKIVDTFTAQNTFYILSITNDNKLKFTHFSNSGKNEQVLDLSTKNTENGNSLNNELVSSIFDFGITVIDPNLYTPLFMATGKIKRYQKKSSYILSFDIKKATTLITINLTDFSLTRKVFPYEKLEKEAGSNSFLQNGILYQLTANSETLLLSGIDLKTSAVIQNYRANAKEEIIFKNSPFLIQTENGQARPLKNTSKFLSKLDPENLGLSIYQTPYYNLFTIGGVREVVSGGGLALSIGLGIGGAIAGSDVDFGSDLMNNNTQSLYFESYFDANFKHSNVAFRPMYIDKMAAFTSDNRYFVYNVFSYKGYVILNYYDSKTKEFVMRKFQNFTD